MTKKIIKKRPNWSEYSKPYLPSAPIPPPKTLTNVVSDTELLEIGNYSLCELSSLGLPSGKTLADVIVSVEARHGYDNDIEVECKFFVREARTTDNPHYESAMKKYEKALADYKLKKAAFKDEIKEWKLWVAQQKEDRMLKQIEHAKKILGAAGIKVGE
jgi:hypothetical protein